jgi:hypothetical protein
MNADANGEGFRVLRADPALMPLELLWRWSFGLGLLALLFFAYAHLRQAVLLSDADQAAFSSQDTLAMATAVSGLIASSQPLLLRIFVQIFSVAAVLWIAAAALGRGLLTRILVRRFALDYGLKIASDAPRWTSFAVLKFSRVLMLLILLIGYLGGVLLGGLVNPAERNVLTDALMLMASLAVSSVVWSYVNWVLSLAPIFVVRDGLRPLDSVAAAMGFIRRNHSRLTAIALWNSTLRGLAATVITLAGVATATRWRALPAGAITAVLALETLVYLVGSNFFLLARLAAYCSVAVRELSFSQSLPESPAPSGTPGA